MIVRRSFFVAFVVLWSVVVSPEILSEESVQGVWRLSTYDMDYRDTPNLDPPPSVLIFTQKHYSAILPYDNEGMLEYAERWSPTDQEKLKRFGERCVEPMSIH